MKMTMGFLALLAAGPALAQVQGPSDQKVNQVLVYGDQPCPKPVADEIIVCVRSPDDPYRLPKSMRNGPPSPQNEAWARQVKAIEYVGKSGIQSCSPTGAGGFTGCMKQMIDKAYAERVGDGTWTALVEAERAKRLGNLDAESEAIEARAKLEEEDARKPAPAPVVP